MAVRNNAKFGALDVQKTAFLLCDMQEGFRSDTKHFDEVIQVSNKMLKAAKIFNIPVYASEHERKDYGYTVKDIKLDDAVFVYEKDTFSMYTEELREKMKKDLPDLQSVVIFGVEAHICVEQTVIDLLGEGISVHILADGVSSRSLVDRELALQRFHTMRSFVSSSECVLYKLLRSTKHPANDAITELNITITPVFGQAEGKP